MDIIDLIDNSINKIVGRKVSKGFLQFFRYLICGGMATLSDMIVLFILTHFFSVNHLLSAALGFFVGIATNYTLNTVLVFRSSGKVKKELPLFALIGLGGLAWTEIIMWIFVDKLSLKVMIAKIIAVIIVLNWNFFMRKKFVFPAESNLVTLEKSISEM